MGPSLEIAMTTNRSLELIAAYRYPNSLANMQQLIMDAEQCAKKYGKTSIFGTDKFQPALRKFEGTLARCVVSLAADGVVKDPTDMPGAMSAVDEVMLHLQDTYSSWPLAFQFWRVYCVRNSRVSWF